MSRDPYQPVWSALDKTGMNWCKQNGKKHIKIKLAGSLVGTIPRKDSRTTDLRIVKNIVARVRRAAVQIKENGYANRA